jgi:CMP-N-acetylneuraminic acid synthetase
MAHKLVALLPLKLHSSRVPDKNFRSLAGRPLVRWILETLLEIEQVERIVINTDARKRLAEVGVTDTTRVLIRDRRPEICGDDVSMNVILEDDIKAVPSDLYLMTHTTNPHLSAKTIGGAISAFGAARTKEGKDSLFTVNRFQTRFYRADGSPINHDPQKLIPTQQLEPWFEENSCLYLFSAESFSKTKARIGQKPLLFATSRIESVDIDTPEDWELASMIAAGKTAGGARDL